MVNQFRCSGLNTNGTTKEGYSMDIWISGSKTQERELDLC